MRNLKQLVICGGSTPSHTRISVQNIAHVEVKILNIIHDESKVSNPLYKESFGCEIIEMSDHWIQAYTEEPLTDKCIFVIIQLCNLFSELTYGVPQIIANELSKDELRAFVPPVANDS